MPERQPTDVPAAGDDTATLQQCFDAAGCADPPQVSGDTCTEVIAPGDPDADRPGADLNRRRLRVVAAVVAALGLLYVADLAMTHRLVPRGVTAAGVPVGGLRTEEAEQRLRAAIEPRASQPVMVTVGGADGQIDPVTVGLTVDWQATLEQAGSQPLNPITRITSFFTGREIGVVSAADGRALNAELEKLAPIVDNPPVEGSVRFQDGAAAPVDPQVGQRLDMTAAAVVLRREWATGAPVALPLVELLPSTTAEDVATALEEVARPALSGPVTVVGDGGTRGVIPQSLIASTLTFRAENGELVPEINLAAVADELRPQLASSERPGRDAALDFESGSAVMMPSQDGRGVDYQATLIDLLAVLTGTEERTITTVYTDQPAEFTTADLENLGEPGVIGEFETGGFATDSGKNIRRAAAQLDGIVVRPGETFSLNAATNPRNAAAGYVEAGVIQAGRPARAVGGGVSQIATTLYNAAYFAGMVDVEHQEHSYYISRYPAGREATVTGDIIDVKFRNDNPTAALIQTAWTPSSITVRLLGIKRYEVTSSQGPRTNPTSPSTVTVPAGEPCSASVGSPGFTITDTRTLREISTGTSRTETHTVRYDPAPKVICGS